MDKIIKLVATLVIATGALFINSNAIKEEKKQEVIIEDNTELSKFKSKEELENMIEDYFNKDDAYDYRYYMLDSVSSAIPQGEMNKAEDAVAPTTGGADSEYSETNVQVQGVDEADIVKTNGDFIYYLTNNELQIIKTTPSGKMDIEKTMTIKENEYSYGRELYIDDNYIIVVSNGARKYDVEIPEDNVIYNEKMAVDSIMPVGDYRWYNDDLSVVTIIDINTYKVVKTFEVSGSYVSSRKIDDKIYLVSNKYIYRNYPIMPVWRDTLEGEDYKEIAATDIYYFKDFDECNYMMVSSIDLENIKNKPNIQTFLGAGTNMYASKDSLFIARVDWEYDRKLSIGSIRYGDWYDYDYDITTSIHKFDIKDGEVKYVATGIVPGSLLNQFSMDEYNGYFRITTTDESYSEDSRNNLYVLDGKMEVVGKIEGLAKGERIYSTRFMGDKCYVVTYKTVDPLFVIDLEDPTNPNVLGELKIPGYSSYLHPLGENYLIGFGEDSVEKSYINWNGETEVTAYATGLKLAIFDITDFYNPKELHSIKIGGRGSWSELLSNHKTLLFDEEKKLFAFPAYVYSDGKPYDNGVPGYGELEFSGALVFNLSVEDGISLRGKITHSDNVTSRWYNQDIERIIYIGNVLYTLSNQKVMSNDINSIEKIDEIAITTEEPIYRIY